MRVLILAHRYLGVALGVIMTLWCLSGFVMIYRGYPRLDEDARLRGLETLVAPARPLGVPVGDDVTLLRFRVETRAGRPVLEVEDARVGRRSIDLAPAGGAAPAPLTSRGALAIAKAYAAGNSVGGEPRDLGVIAEDQWTVEDARRNGPVHHIRFDDPRGTEIYVADRDGAVVQATTRAARVWGWLGAVPHWLYPTVLRQHAKLWSSVVIWTALAGCFLTAIGLYVGVARFRPSGRGGASPYRGWVLWHHLTGLVFGLLTLTWVASGLMSMNPWGLFDTPVEAVQRRVLAGDFDGRALKAFLARAPLDGGFVSLRGAPLGGRLFVMATRRDGEALRLDADARPAPLSAAEMSAALRATHPSGLRDFALLTSEDDYYYSGYDGAVRLPVYRARLADPAATALYVDPTSGEVIRAVDGAARASRWLRTGPHDWDFGWLRRGRLRDGVMLVLLAGVTGLCALGAWLGIRRAGRDLSRLRSRKKRAPPGVGR